MTHENSSYEQHVLAKAADLHRRGHLTEAESLYLQLITASSEWAAPRQMLGFLRIQQGRLVEAIQLTEAALDIEPENSNTLSQYGHVLKALERFPEAATIYARLLALAPDNVSALVNHGVVQRHLQRLNEALASFDRALTMAPQSAGIWLNRGVILSDLARFDEAIVSFRTAISLDPYNAQSYNNHGLTLFHIGRLEEAVVSLEKALALDPSHWEALNNLGLTLLKLAKSGEALGHFEKALLIRPGHPDLLANRGAVLLELARPDEALISIDAAIAASPDHIHALTNRARRLFLIGNFAESLNAYDKVLAVDPENLNAFGAVAELALKLCDWPRTEKILAKLDTHIFGGRNSISPFCLLGYRDDPLLQLKCAENHAKTTTPAQPIRMRGRTTIRNEKIKIAYLSSDFNEHPVARVIAELLEAHDRDRFEILGFGWGVDDDSTVRARLKKAFSSFHDVRQMSDIEIARQIRNRDVDITIDLNGYTQGGRPSIFHHRPAPIQAGFVGYPGSLGTASIDYVIGDGIVTPMSAAPFYCEKIVQLPDCYLPADKQSPFAIRTSSRAEAGLPSNGIVFCCFNNSWKITAQVFSVWMKLLRAVPGSVLWLSDTDQHTIFNLRREALARGIEACRLVFARYVPFAEHLARHQLADLFLDTLPYNAHVTATYALRAGLPLITCEGKSFAGRVAASQLQALGLPELSTQSLEEYEALALKLATDNTLLRTYREKLLQNQLSFPLFNTDRYRRAVEAAYSRMWEINLTGGTPQSFRVELAD